MEIPESLNILGKDCRILWVSRLKDKDGVECHGLFCPDKFEIYIDKALKKDPIKSLETLIHELGHAVLERLYINSDLPVTVEECIVEGFKNLIMETIRPLLE